MDDQTKQTIKSITNSDQSIIHDRDINGRNAFHYSSFYGNLELIHFLFLKLKNKNLINQFDHFHFTPLLLASFCGHISIVKKLLFFGADPNLNLKFFRFSSLHFLSRLSPN